MGLPFKTLILKKIPMNKTKTQTWISTTVSSHCWLPSNIVMTNSCGEFKRCSGLLMITWRDRRYPSELGQRRSDHCTCLTEGGRRPHLIKHTHVNTRTHVPKLYTSTKPGDKASSSSTIWPRLNALQCSAACRLENPAKCSTFLQCESLKKGKDVCVHAVVTRLLFHEVNQADRTAEGEEAPSYMVIRPLAFLHHAPICCLIPETKV